MKDIAIFGAGGFGREVACLIKRINEKEPTWNFIGFFDDNEALKGQPISHFGSCLGNMADLNKWDTPLDVCIAVGNGTIVEKIVDQIKNNNVAFPNIIDPNVTFADEEGFTMGIGNIIQSGSSFSTDVTIGDFNVMNGDVVLGHDDKVGNYNTFMPGVRISGEVTIGNNNFFGVMSIVLQQLKVKNNTKLAAGSVLMTKPKEGFLYMGVPAKKTEF